MEATVKIKNCMNCRNHVVVHDPDPHDSFCSDDEAVLCKATPNNGADPSKYFRGMRVMEYRAITCSCRPYNKRKECEVPKWCPLAK